MTSATGAQRKSRSGGFTLVELMVVTSLFLTMLLAIWPEFGGLYRNYLLETAAHELSARLALARSDAVVQGRLCRIRLEQDSDGYSLYKDGERWGRSGFIPADIRLTQEAEGMASGMPGGSICFYPDGTATAAEIFLENADGSKITLKLDAFTGQSRVES